MTLLYWREYQTYFHLGKSFDISEANCYRNIKWIEDILIKNSDFQQLAGKKALINDYFNDKTIIIDATETPIQRPKKDKNNLILVKKKKTHDQNTSNYRTRNKKNYCNKFFARKKTWLCFI
ncbi:helix-turn-helix domain-containing protein [Spiroplasma poulsonii]|uniref:helix-turn-helix domain-containing protein n=1 Tax=Spiroplasma poulsonii TaxID=2138 RepID=UPI001F540AD8|nr:transposase family protein [Spiroplasma poulsonii]